MNRRFLLLIATLFLAFLSGYEAKVTGKKDDAKVIPPKDAKKDAKNAAASASAKKPEGAPAVQDYYWYNVKTGVSQWEDPMPVYKHEESGVDYYIDPVSGESTWEKPAKYAWKETFSEEHKTTYYYNEVTKESVWDKPAEMSWTKIKTDGAKEL